jgi:hypothetical protein
MHKLYKPCGKEVQVNDSSLSHALSLGWKEKKPAVKKTTKKASTDGNSK